MTFTEPPPMSRAKAIAYAVSLPVCLLALVFLPVGRLDWKPGWLFVGILVIAFAVSALSPAALDADGQPPSDQEL